MLSILGVATFYPPSSLGKKTPALDALTVQGYCARGIQGSGVDLGLSYSGDLAQLLCYTVPFMVSIYHPIDKDVTVTRGRACDAKARQHLVRETTLATGELTTE